MKNNQYVIALAGNPNSGKTTLFNSLTGSNQYVGNWPGVTVEKKEGKLKGHRDVMIEDLPGIYSLSPYTMEEVVSRTFLVDEKPDAIIDIVDGTNLERNLYLTTQLAELGIPMVVAVNMADLLEKNNKKVDIKRLREKLGCDVIDISALKGMNVDLLIESAVKSAKEGKAPHTPQYSKPIEEALEKISTLLPDGSESLKRWYSIKLFERDNKAYESLNIDSSNVEEIIKKVESDYDDDAEAIITNERYEYIANELRGDSTVAAKGSDKLTISDRIDQIVTNRFLAIPIFALIMFFVYYLTVSTIGSAATDWANDGLFGDGFFLFGNGREQYTEAMNSYYEQNIFTNEVKEKVSGAVEAGIPGAEDIQGAIEDVDYEAFDEAFGFYGSELEEKEGGKYAISDVVEKATGEESEMPSPEQFGTWIPGIPVLVENVLDSIGTNDFLKGLILDGIIGGVGAVLGFVPQMLVLFFLLAILEYCGYMARIAFVMDRLFRKFGLSGKSFIPVMIGTGCGVPGIMASRTIENERDRRMTIMTTTFIPCGAKLPIIMMIATALFGGSALIAVSSYFIGLAAIVISGIILKKTKMFAGDPAPFVMELPPYHLPSLGAVLRSTWERGWSFIKKAGTVILISSIVIWLGSTFGWSDGVFGWNPDLELEESVLGAIGNAVKWIFTPLGFDNIKATIATVMGLVAKEEVVGVFGVLDFEGLTKLAGYSFLVFNLLCAPCFAAIGAIKREMNNAKWTWFAIGYQCLFAYVIALIIYQLGKLFTGGGFGIWTIVAIACLGCLVWLLFRPYKEATHLETSFVNH